MHRVVSAACLLVLAFGCRPTSQSTAVANAQFHDKIPITTRSPDARAAFQRGRALTEDLKPHEAHILFLQAMSLDPSFAMGAYGLATTAPTARSISEYLQRAVALADSASAGERLLILAFQARRNGNPARARQLAESLVTRYPKDERARYTLGSAYSAHQQYERAIGEYRTAIAHNPTFSLAYNQLGYAYLAAGQMAAAESSFTQYIALVPGDPNPYDSYAELLMKAGRFDESIAQYRKALSIDPYFAGSFVGIAANEMFAGRHHAAIAECERYFAVARDDYERRTALLTLAMVHIDRGATDQALEVMERRAALARATHDTVNMSADAMVMGNILLEAGRVEEARQRFTQSHALLAGSSAPPDLRQDDALGVRYDAARVALALGDVEHARTEALAYAAGAAARKNDVRLRQAHELNGHVALATKQFDWALAELALADKQSPAVLWARARAYAAMGRSAKAEELAGQALHMNILPTLHYVFTRASIAAATRSATSGSAGGRPR